MRGSVEIFEPFEQADMLPMWMQQPDSMEHLARVLGQIFVTCHELYAFYQDSGINPRMSMRRQYFDNDIPEALQGARYRILQCCCLKLAQHTFCLSTGQQLLSPPESL